ncbi:hypothetical protein ACI65C_013750 [Semiaphis heraclei]
MPRIKKKPLGTRHYVNYSDEVLNECLQEINSGRMTQRAAAAAYKIPRSTIKNKLKDRLPQNLSGVNNEFVGSAFIEQLDAKRQDYLGTSGTKKNRKKLNVPSGKSINEEPIKSNQEKLNPEDVAVDNFVLVLFNKEKYPGKVHSISKEGVMVDCMEKRLTCWRCWPQRQDISLYDWKDVLTKINPPKMISRRNQFSVPELNSFI